MAASEGGSVENYRALWDDQVNVIVAQNPNPKSFY